MRIQEIAEELVNLSLKEVNELAHIMQSYDMPQSRYRVEIVDKLSTPKNYGLKLYEHKHKKRR